MPTQLVPPIRYVLSTWAICSTIPLLATPRLIVSPVALPSRSRNGWATATRPASAPPRQAKLTNISPGRNRPWSSRLTSPLRSSASSSREVVDLASPVAALSPVNVIGSAECTTSESRRAARSTACVPFWLLICALSPGAFSSAEFHSCPAGSTLWDLVLLCDRKGRSSIGQVAARRTQEPAREGTVKADVRQHDAEVRDPLRRLDRGARPRLAPDRLRDRHPVRQAGGRRAVRQGGPAGGRRRGEAGPGVRARAGREGAARVRRAGPQPG